MNEYICVYACAFVCIYVCAYLRNSLIKAIAVVVPRWQFDCAPNSEMAQLPSGRSLKTTNFKLKTKSQQANKYWENIQDNFWLFKKVVKPNKAIDSTNTNDQKL